MKKIHLLAIISLLCIVFSCQNSQFNDLYKKSIQYYPKHLIEHFPNEIDDNSTYFTSIKFDLEHTDTCHGFQLHDFMLVKQFNADEFNIEFNKILNDSLLVFSSNDTNQVLIGVIIQYDKYKIIHVIGYEEGDESRKILARNMKNSDGLPLPIFNIDNLNGNTSTRLSEDFTIYIIDCMPGKILELGHNSIKNTDILPSKWRNGYSRGYAVSKKRKIVIYWVIAW